MGYNPWGCKETDTAEHVRTVKQSRRERKEETEEREKIEAGGTLIMEGLSFLHTRNNLFLCVFPKQMPVMLHYGD